MQMGRSKFLDWQALFYMLVVNCRTMTRRERKSVLKELIRDYEKYAEPRLERFRIEID